jgi:hypothetical protein
LATARKTGFAVISHRTGLLPIYICFFLTRMLPRLRCQHNLSEMTGGFQWLSEFNAMRQRSLLGRAPLLAADFNKI